MDDLTLLYITNNEMPAAWVEYQLETLHTAVPEAAIVSVSRKPMELGRNLIDDGERGYWNIYVQMRRAAEVAETPFVAMVEDDVLYSREHFTQFRPSLEEVSYNRSRWSLFSWDPMYCLRQRISNCSLIAGREYLIDALKEREHRWATKRPPARVTGEVGRPFVDKGLQVAPRNMVEWYSTTPIIHLNHPSGTDDRAQRKWKKHGQIKAFDIPFWGKAEDIASRYNNSLQDSQTPHAGLGDG